MTKRVLHQDYLEAWLRGESVVLKYGTRENWRKFGVEEYQLDAFNNVNYEFRITPKTIEVNLTEFYAEYDSITSVNFREAFLEDLIAKYLPRGWFPKDIPTDILKNQNTLLAAGESTKCLRVCENYRRITKCLLSDCYDVPYHHL